MSLFLSRIIYPLFRQRKKKKFLLPFSSLSLLILAGDSVRKTYQLIPAGSSPSGKTTESAVYGYVQKPEIVEFRGQYFYGPNPSPASHHHGHYSPIPAASHHYSPGLSASASDSVASSSSWAPFSTSSKISNKSGIHVFLRPSLLHTRFPQRHNCNRNTPLNEYPCMHPLL